MKYGILLLISLLTSSAFAQTKYVKINGYNVEYQMSGKGKHVILLEAGGSAGLSDWDPIFENLTKNTRVIRYSRIGNGGSEPLKKNYSSEEYAQEALLLLEVLKVDQPIVYIAHSYGAYIARRFAAMYPDKLSALMLIEPASEHDVDIMRKINLELAEQQIAQIKLDDLANGLSNQYLDFWAKRPLPDYPEIPDVPLTVIASTKKFAEPTILFFTDEGRELWGKLHSDWVSTFPQGEVVLTNRSYHYPQRDEPQMVLTEIMKLLSRIKN